jgi:hypothetical protein
MLGTMNQWDVALLAIAGYVAVVSLARLMLRRRDQLLAEFREQLQRERRKKAEQEKRKRAEEEQRQRPAA